MPGQQLLLREYGDHCVLYNDLSGDTHLLGGSAVHLLELLAQGPADSPRLSEALAGAIGCPHDAAFEEQVQALLAQLASFFLVESMSC